MEPDLAAFGAPDCDCPNDTDDFSPGYLCQNFRQQIG
jgi:hypothetical protein